MTTLRVVPFLLALPLLGGSISGRITNSATGAGINDARVRIYGSNGNKAVTTDENGVYKFDGLADGAYSVAASKIPGYRPTQDFPMRITVSAKNAQGDVRADLQLTPLASIHGRVLDSQGAPVAGVAVEPYPRMAGAITGKDGAFVISNLQPGSYTLSAKAKPRPQDDANAETIVTTYYPDAIDSERAVSIRVGDSDLLGYDIRLQTAAARRVRGIVVGVDGKPSVGANVALFKPASGFMTSVQGPGQPFAPPPALESINTNKDGSFEFPAVLEGNWILRASFSSRDAVQHADIYLGANANVNVTKTDIDDLKLRLAPPFNIEISIDFADAPPTNTRARATAELSQLVGLGQLLQPLDGAWSGGVNAIRRDTPTYIPTTGGRFLIRPSSGSGFYLASAAMDGRDVLGQVVEIAGPAKIQVVYRAGGGDIRGTVQNGAGTTVVAMAKPTVTGRLGWSTRCLADNNFLFPGVPPGEYTLFAYRGNDDASTPEFQGRIAAQGTRVKIEAGENDLVQLKIR